MNTSIICKVEISPVIWISSSMKMAGRCSNDPWCLSWGPQLVLVHGGLCGHSESKDSGRIWTLGCIQWETWDFRRFWRPYCAGVYKWRKWQNMEAKSSLRKQLPSGRWWVLNFDDITGRKKRCLDLAMVEGIEKKGQIQKPFKRWKWPALSVSSVCYERCRI